MKRMLFILLTLLSLSSFAQHQTKTTPPQPVQVFMGYIIKLNSTAEGGYGYDILTRDKIVVSQKQNPFTLSQKGLANREDAFKIAHWQVQELVAGASPALISGQPLPRALAKQLNIVLE